MRTTCPSALPVARRKGLVTKEVGSELLIYDRARDRAHCLNESAAAVWRRCDGQATPADIARSITKQHDVPVDEAMVCLALAQLRRRHLLKPFGSPTVRARSTLTRREAIRRFGIGAAVAVPLIVTIVAPFPGQAGSCRGVGATCGTGSQCCSGVCSSGSCLGGPASRDRRTPRR